MLSRSLRRPSKEAWKTGLIVVALAGGCLTLRGAEPSWTPLPAGASAAGMASTLVPETELGMDLPRFVVADRQLESGLRIGVESVPARGQVAVVMAIAAGSADDPPGREGLAHLVEHLVYHARSGGEPTLSDRLLGLGARYNADTGLDATRFHEVVPASALPALLAMASERLTHPLAGVDEADVERERAIIENELNQRNELGVAGQVVAWMQRTLYPAGHPSARPIGGTQASLRRLTLADARRFAAAHYRPDATTLLVAGEVGGQAPLASVSALLPRGLAVRQPEAARRRALVPAATGATAPAPAPGAAPAREEDAQDVLRAAVANPELWIAWDLGGGAETEAMNRILVGSAAERIVREHLLPEPEVLSVDFHPMQLGQGTWLACEIVLQHGKRRIELARKARNLIWALWSDAGPPAAIDWEGWRQGAVLDLRRAALTSAVLGTQPFLERALGRATAFQATGRVDQYDRALGRIATVRLREVSDRAYEFLAPERARTLFVEPLAEADRPAAGAVGVRGAEGLGVASGATRATEFKAPPPLPAPAGLDRTRAFALANGLEVILIPRPQFPSVTALLGFHGGAAALPAGILELVRAVDPRAKSGRSSALTIEPADGLGFTADLVHTDRRHLSNALFLLGDRLNAVAETNWSLILQRARERGGSTPPVTEDPRRQAVAKVLGRLYPGHPYSREIHREEIRGLDPGLVEAWLPHLYNPRNATLVIAGDIDVDAAARLVTGWFGGWLALAGTGRLSSPPLPPPTARADARPGAETVLVTHRPVASQVEVDFACRLAPAATPRARAAQKLLGGLLGSRLLTQIREQAGAAYSVDGGAAPLPGGGHLMITMAVDSRRLRDALAILRGDLAAMKAGRPDPGGLSQVRWSLTRDAGLRDLTDFELAQDVFRARTLGLPPSSVATQVDELARVTPDEIARAFSPCMGDPVLSLVGDEAIIRSARSARSAQ